MRLSVWGAHRREGEARGQAAGRCAGAIGGRPFGVVGFEARLLLVWARAASIVQGAVEATTRMTYGQSC
jgi:hypothetical protein